MPRPMARSQPSRRLFSLAVVSLAVLGGLVEWAALLRARVNGQFAAPR